MYNKTIWNPGDIITQEKWNNINNNLSILGAYQLPVTIEEVNGKVTVQNTTIHKSYDEITKLLKQGVICWYFNNIDGRINYITEFNDQNRTLNNGMLYENGAEMTIPTFVPSDPIK